jgi:hypothetical protein
MDAWIWVLISALVAGIVTLLIRFLPGLELVSKGIDGSDDIKPGFGTPEEREVGNAGATWEWREHLDKALTSDDPQVVEAALQELKRLRERKKTLEEDTGAILRRDVDEAIVLAQASAPRMRLMSSRAWVIMAVVAVGFVVLATMTSSMLRFKIYGVPVPTAATHSPWRDAGLWAFYFGMMLFGMAGQYFWRLKSMKRFELGEFVRPLWISFIVFTPFWTASKVDGISYVAAAAAYQNGFFWKVVLDKEEKKMKSAKPRVLGETKRKNLK